MVTHTVPADYPFSLLCSFIFPRFSLGKDVFIHERSVIKTAPTKGTKEQNGI